MSLVPSTKHLSQLSIPATHQSLAINVESIIGNAVCQGRPIYEQLLDGIRAFDLRFHRWTAKGQAPCLYAYHGGIHEIVSFAAVLQSVKLFLTRFPNETIIMKPSNEGKTDGFAEAFMEDFKLFADSYPSLFFDMTKHKRMCDITLAQTRGKAILLKPKHGPKQLWSTKDFAENRDNHQDWDCLKPCTKYWVEEDMFW